MNKTASKEWLVIAFHDLKGAEILYEANHYTDSIGSILQQALEKTLKAILASQNRKIPKSHDLYEIYDLIEVLDFNEEELELLDKATLYLKEERYPNPNYSLPSRDKIREVLEFTQKLFYRVCNILEIRVDDL